MHHSIAAIFDQRAFDGRLVADVALDDNQRLATDLLNAVQRCGIAVAEVIENNDLLTGVEKVNAGMRAHVPGASSYQDHSVSLTEAAHGVMPDPGGKVLDLSYIPLMRNRTLPVR